MHIFIKLDPKNISIHAPRGGSDLISGGSIHAVMLFQSTLPVGGATAGHLQREVEKNISIHAPRGGSDDLIQQTREQTDISIHAPRGGSDTDKSGGKRRSWISIHAPRGGSDGWKEDGNEQ